ncbi:MAG: threonine synthase, partial [Actinobacteria bacterium]|nr:threonine synthase [Actinomycetota bacterium]
VDDIPAEDLKALCARAYTAAAFGDEAIVPVSELGEGLWLAHLSNGPTAAFKDLAMQLLGQLFEYELERRHQTLTILGATSGDTGSAAEYAMLGKPSIRVFMLSPQGRMSAFQQAQMFSILDPHIVNIAVPVVFDDSQDLVKEVFSDADFKRRHAIGAVNSINVARLLAQVVYYVVAWLRTTTGDDERVSFCVPSGNFGNICAGHIAREMGLPVERLVLATNENTVLHEFFSTGVYRVRASSETYETSSPSMDISKASNFERFAFDLLGRDQDLVRDLFGVRLRETGEFDLSATPEFAAIRDRYGFVSGASSHADRIRTIREVHDTYGVLIDPHTADGVTVAQRLVGDEPMVVLETALPVKFASTIVEAVGVEPDRPARFDGIEDLPRRVTVLSGGADELKAIIEDAARY